eukprot:6720271-Karenia_brevis.AAC.1
MLSLPWLTNEDGSTQGPCAVHGDLLGIESIRDDAKRYALCHARDARALMVHNHDHNCSFTCVKKVQSREKNTNAQDSGTLHHIVCRFLFYTSLVFK